MRSFIEYSASAVIEEYFNELCGHLYKNVGVAVSTTRLLGRGMGLKGAIRFVVEIDALDINEPFRFDEC